ncbi:MAG TPA: 50S ribosomal protein L11 methyltransferase [Candidatus Paceibacterota bacterium]|nr:50S ribosomal protein L11 methyltransferase [Verrucomicrobiota bacterium]HSA11609.1 50S ribosomal protein L11 methyltransferase [Candidatus Paceibacterota bacterium]
MKQNSLWRISIATTPEAEDAVAELLGSTFSQPAASYTDVETGQTTVSAYLRARSAWSGTRRAELASGLERITASGLDLGPGRISIKRIRRADWAESWKRHFRPMEIGSALLLKPGWSRHRPRKGQAVVVLDPGLSFGTGRHPTTAFCLRQLVARRRRGQAQSCLDVGTGSGILAIAAAKLGYAPVDAFDCDPQSVQTARANARRNRVSGQIRFRQQDLTRLPRQTSRQYSLICANLVTNLLLEQQQRLLTRLRRDGVMVVAGILAAEFAKVQRACSAAGLRLLAARTQREWRSGAFGWRHAPRRQGK